MSTIKPSTKIIFIMVFLAVIPLAGFTQGKETVDTIVYSKDGRCCDTILYRKIRCGLYVSNKGDIAFRTEAMLNDEGDMGTRYITWIYGADVADTTGNAGLMEMKYVIDTVSFRFLDLIYWSDRRRVYGFNPMSDGGTVYYIEDADPRSFKALGGSPYGKDKKNVFYKGSVIPGADVKSFVIVEDRSVPELARDKRTYYFSGEPLTENELMQMRKK